MGNRSTAQQTLTARHGSTRRKRIRGQRMSMREQLVAPLARLWWLLLLIAAAAGVLGYVVSGIRPPVYQASTTILFPDAGAGLKADDVERALTSRAALAVSLPNLERVTQAVPGTTTAGLAKDVTVTPDPVAFGLRVAVRSGSATQAAQIADAVVTSFGDGEKAAADAAAKEVQTTYDARLAEIDRQITDAQAKLRAPGTNTAASNQLQQLQAERVRLAAEEADAVTEAQKTAFGIADIGATAVPSSPASPRPVQDGIVTALVALFITAGILLERNRRAWGDVVDSVELSQAMGVPLLGEISTNPNSTSGGAAALGLAVSRLRIAAGKDGGVFLLAPVVEGADGARAAHLLAEASSRTRWWPVALLHRALTFGGGWSGQGPDGAPAQLAPGTVVPVPYGSIESAEKTLTDLRSRGALVVVEGPPARRGGDSSRLALAADGVIVVVADDQPVEAALDVIDILSMLPTPILGYVWVSTSGALTQSLPVIAPDGPPMPKAKRGRGSEPASVDVTGFVDEPVRQPQPAGFPVAAEPRREEQAAGPAWPGTVPPAGAPSIPLATPQRPDQRVDPRVDPRLEHRPEQPMAPAQVPSPVASPAGSPAASPADGPWSAERGVSARQESPATSWRFGLKAVPTPPFLVKPSAYRGEPNGTAPDGENGQRGRGE